MPIEAILIEIRDELRPLNARMAHIGGAAPADAPAAPKTTKGKQVEKPAEAPAAPAKASDAVKLDYPTVSAAVKAKVIAGKREPVVTLLKAYGVGHAQELKPEQYAEFLDKLNAL